MSTAVHRRALYCIVFAALAFAGSAAAVPFPLQREGNGNEPVAGAGVFAGTAFHPTTAFVRWDPHLQVLDLMVFGNHTSPRDCAAVARASANSPRLVEVGLSHRAKRLPVGRPLPVTIAEFVGHAGGGAPQVHAVQRGVRLVLTRVDTSRGGVWHGRLSVRSTRIAGKRYGYGGTFSARWCNG
jgi:hypothetical protein